MKLPAAVRSLSEQLERLPGIGPKTAQRLALYMLRLPDSVLADFATSVTHLKERTKFCVQCHHIGESDICAVCGDSDRDASKLCVVQSPLDVLALESTGQYTGRYHVLHGVIAPLENIGPDQLFLRDILNRLEGVDEVIVATNPSMEGEATALYIERIIRDAGHAPEQVRVTRIGYGLSMGSDIEYADSLTLSRALDGRRDI